MSAHFEEIDWRPTPMGELSLRRRRDLSLDRDVYEIKLDDDFLMSSLFTAGEIALARLGLAKAPGAELDVVVGGLGLGHTAQAVLEHAGVRSLIVIDALSEVIEWHRRGLMPLSDRLTSDARCRLVHGDFFTMADTGLDPEDSGRRFHAVLVDIDHSPRHILHPAHAPFYRPAGLRRLAARLRPGGVFGLWSNDPPDEEFTSVLAEVFSGVETHVVDVPTFIPGRTGANTVYTARTEALSG